MSETIKLVLTKFTDETFAITLSILIIVSAILVAYWLYNRRRFHKLSHQIPASIVKNYLDSIIQNSQALKSSLFRGGGADVGNGIPSVMPLNDLAQGAISLKTTEELNQKNAEISILNSKIAEKDRVIQDLERQLTSKGGADPLELKKLKDEIKSHESVVASLKGELDSVRAQKGGDPEAAQKVVAISKERDELKEKLQEYEIIEEDLANLKRLQQENEQLKKALGGGADAVVAQVAQETAPKTASTPPKAEVVAETAQAPAPAPEEDFESQMAAAISDQKAPAEAPVAAPEEDLEAQMAAAIADQKKAPAPAPVEAALAPVAKEEPAIPANEGEQKSADQLLSEFEKMLG